MTQNITEVRMSHLTGRDARAVLAANPVILLPLGSHEDQGPHAPMGDFLLAQKVAELGAAAAHSRGNPTYVAPVIAYGGIDFFESMIGGATLQPETLTALLTDILTSFIRNGLTRIAFVNGHHGNIGPIGTVARRMQANHGLAVPSLNIWQAAYAMLPNIVGAEETKRRAGHGADPLASVAQHLFPELVRRDYMPEQRFTEPDPYFGLPVVRLGQVDMGGTVVDLPTDYGDVFHEGVGNGDPRLSDAKTGKALVDGMVDAVARLAALWSAGTPST